jgi:hypothetical protein
LRNQSIAAPSEYASFLDSQAAVARTLPAPCGFMAARLGGRNEIATEALVDEKAIFQ